MYSKNPDYEQSLFAMRCQNHRKYGYLKNDATNLAANSASRIYIISTNYIRLLHGKVDEASL